MKQNNQSVQETEHYLQHYYRYLQSRASGKRSKVMSSSHMHDSFEQVHFSELVKSIHQIELNGRKQFTAQAAQIYKLLNQNIL